MHRLFLLLLYLKTHEVFERWKCAIHRGDLLDNHIYDCQPHSAAMPQLLCFKRLYYGHSNKTHACRCHIQLGVQPFDEFADLDELRQVDLCHFS